MKKLLLTFSLFAVTCSALAQNYLSIWNEQFSSQADFDAWTHYIDPASTSTYDWTLDCNATVPGHNDLCKAFLSNLNPDNNAWLVSPDITLQAGVTYRIHFWRRFRDANNAHIDVHAAASSSILTFNTSTLIYSVPQTQPTNAVIEEFAFFTPPATGSYCIGFNGWNTANSYIVIDDISVEAPIPLSAGVKSIDSPVSGNNLSSAETLKVTVKNYGSQNTGSTIPLTVEMNGDIVAAATLPAMAAGAEYTHTFSTSLDLSAAGTYALKAYTSLAGDQYNGDDTLQVSIVNTVCAPQTTISEDFENASSIGCWQAVSRNTENASLLQRKQNPSGGAHSGSFVWQFSSYTPSQGDYSQYIISPEIAIGAAPRELTFFYRSSTWDEYFRVGYSTSTSDFSSFLWEDTTTATSAVWNEYVATVPATARYIAIEYTPNRDRYYLFIDDFSLQQLPDYDAAAIAVVSPQSGINMTANETVQVLVKNIGLQNLSPLPVKLVAGGVIYTQSLSSIASGDTDTVSFTGIDLSAAGIHNLIVYTDYSSDMRHSNDTVTAQIQNTLCQLITTGWQEYFDGDFPPSNCWLSQGFNAQGNISGMYSWYKDEMIFDGSEIPRTFLRKSYTNGSRGVVYTPPFSTMEGEKIFSLYIYRDDRWDDNDDSINLYITALQGIDLTLEIPQMQVHRYYQSTPAVAQPGWYKYNLTLPQGYQQAYVAVEGAGANGFDMYIDDFALSGNTVDAGVASITKPAGGASSTTTSSETVEVVVNNYGGESLTNVPVKYSINGTLKGSATIASLPAGTNQTLSFPQTADLSQEGTYIIKAYTDYSEDNDRRNDTASITLTRYICNEETLPLTQNFETSLSPCWTSTATNALTAGTGHSGTQYWRLNNQGEYIMSPKLPATTADKTFEVWYMRSFINTEGFTVGYSVTDNQIASFTWLPEQQYPEAADDYNIWKQYSTQLPGAARYVAIKYTTESNWLYFDDIEIDALFQIVSTNPTANAVNVALNQNIELTYSKSIALTAGDAKSKVEITADGFPLLVNSVTASGNVLTVTHPAFASQTVYQVHIGNNLVENYTRDTVWQFTTVAPTAIAVQTCMPANQSQNVTALAAVWVDFDKAVNTNGVPNFQGTNKPVIYLSSDPSKTINLSAAIDTQNENRLVITHDSLWQGLQNFTVKIPKSAITGLAADVVWSFTTAPAVISAVNVFPPNNATEILPSSLLGFDIVPSLSQVAATPHFDQIYITDAAQNRLEGINVSGGTDVGNVGYGRVSIEHPLFYYNTAYTVHVPVATFTGAGLLSAPIEWTFTITPPQTLTPETLTPLNNAVGVSADAEISALFSNDIEQFFPPDFSGSNLPLIFNAAQPSEQFPVSQVLWEEKKLTLVHSLLPYETKIGVSIPKTSIPGLQNNVEWSFTTEKQGYISDTQNPELWVVQQGDNLIIGGVSQTSEVKIYSLQGRLILATTQKSIPISKIGRQPVITGVDNKYLKIMLQ